jgi:NMD protein affecting ribosome stability and mRNA decay
LRRLDMPKKTGKGLLERAPHIVRRKSIDPEGSDPYLNKDAPDDMALCRRCGAVYHEKRWYKREDLPGKLAGSPNTALVLCPGCQKVRDKYAEGYLSIEGQFVEEHGDEIMNVIENKEGLQAYINPLEQIVEIKRFDGHIEVQTTTEKLAQRIGQILQKAFSGELVYKWSKDKSLARIIWTRD